MSDAPLVRGIVVAHGNMAQGLVEAVRRITGTQADALTPISNDGQGPEQLREQIETLCGCDPVVVFADLVSGSCGMAAAISCKEPGTRIVLCGVNLPILLDFVFHRDVPLDELVPRLVSKGREGIRSLPQSG